MPNTIDRSLLDAKVKRWLAHFLKLVLWESVVSMESFLKILSPSIRRKLDREIPKASRKDRLDDLDKRAFRWIERTFWDDIRRFPDDSLDKRILRLKKIFNNTPRIPHRQGDSEPFPISVFIEYDSIFKALQPVFKRYPAELKHLPGQDAKEFVDQTIRRGRGYSRPIVLKALNEKRQLRWQEEQIRQANQIVSLPKLPSGEEFRLEADEFLHTNEAGEWVHLTPRKAALKIMGAKIGLGEEAVWKLVKKGKKMLPPAILKKMEAAYSAIEDNSSWDFLNLIDPPQPQ